MDLSFTWLLHKPELALRQVAAPSAGSFALAQTNELEDATEFIQPDSLVLTVGIAFKDNQSDLGRYVDHLADAGAVAIGFGTGLTFATIPEQVVTTTRRRGIGLFEVPRQIPFISILTAIHQEQRRRAQLEQQRLIDDQERLTRAAIAGSLDMLVSVAADLLDAGVRINGPGAAPVASAESAGYERAVKDGKRLRTSTHRLVSGPQRPYSLEVTSAQRPPAALLRHCAGLADMLLARPAELRAARNELNAFALSARFGLGDEAALLPRGFDTPIDDSGLTRPAVITADRRRALEQARSALDTAADTHGHFLYAAPLDRLSMVVLVHPDQDGAELLAALGPTAQRVRVAVSRPLPAADLDAAHIRALKSRCGVLALGDSALPGSSRASWLTEPAVAEALRAQRKELFGVLETEDAERHTDYARTLTVFLQHGGQLAQTAEALGIHRHTARSRIARIQELCGIDLADPATFAEAFFAATSEV